MVGYFLVDFFLAQQVALETENYPVIIFLLDLSIILTLFVAYDAIHLGVDKMGPEVRWSAGAMFFSHSVAWIWVHKMRMGLGTRWNLLTFYAVAGPAFLILAVLWPNAHAYAVALLFSVVLLIIVGGSEVARFHEMRSSGE